MVDSGESQLVSNWKKYEDLRFRYSMDAASARRPKSASVEIRKGAMIGARCKLSSHTFIGESRTIESWLLPGHSVIFIYDQNPRATAADGHVQTEPGWLCQQTLMKGGASIGSAATIPGGIALGGNAIDGAGYQSCVS